MSKQLWVVYFKEMRDALRDKRSLLAALSYGLFAPLFFAVVLIFTVNQVTSVKSLYIDIQGAEHAPQLIEYLEDRGIYQADEEQADAVKMTIRIPESYKEHLAKGKTVPIVVQAKYSDRFGQGQFVRFERAIQGYNASIVNQRLILRGISPEITVALELDKQDTSSKEGKVAMTLGTVMVFVLMTAFFSGMNVSIDTSAGERERNSLEFLLAQPIQHFDFVLGKAFASATIATIGCAISLLVIPLSMQFVPLEKIGMDLQFNYWVQLAFVLVLVPVALFAAALQLLVSFLAKSFKEAQTYISFVMFIPMGIVMGLEFSRIEKPIFAYLPITSQHQALLGSMNGEPASLLSIIVGSVITVVLAFVVLFIVQRQLQSEKTIFGL